MDAKFLTKVCLNEFTKWANIIGYQGFDHVRYAVIIRNLPNPDKGVKDIFKDLCTKRNPEPPERYD